jgi:hypothetical protein
LLQSKGVAPATFCGHSRDFLNCCNGSAESGCGEGFWQEPKCPWFFCTCL